MRRQIVDEFKKLLYFNIIGLLNTGITYLLYAMLVWLGLSYMIALIGEYAIGVVFTFFANKRFTFRDSGPPTWSAFAKMVVAAAIGFSVNSMLLAFFIDRIGLDKYFGQVVALGLTAIVSFVLQRFFVFPSQGARSE